MCFSAYVYKSEELMEKYITSNHIFKINIHLWGLVYSVYNKINAIGKQKKTRVQIQESKFKPYKL